MVLDLQKFESRLTDAHRKRRADGRTRAYYSPELLAAVERMYFTNQIDLKTIAQELTKEAAFKHVTWQAIHSRLCRHIRKIRGADKEGIELPKVRRGRPPKKP